MAKVTFFVGIIEEIWFLLSVQRYSKLMTSLEQLIQELETIPESLIDEVLDYVSFIKNRHFLKKTEGLRKVSFDEDWWDNLSRFTPDFLERREQPEFPHREELFP